MLTGDLLNGRRPPDQLMCLCDIGTKKIVDIFYNGIHMTFLRKSHLAVLFAFASAQLLGADVKTTAPKPVEATLTCPACPACPTIPTADDVQNTSTESSPLKVLTYNVCYECMTNSSSGSAGALGKLCTFTTKDGVKVTSCAVNIAKAIDDISDYYGGEHPYDFVALQENANWKELQKISKTLRKMEAINHKTNIFYNGDKYTLDTSINSQFEPGRPVQILVFKEGIIVVSLHAPHIKSGLKNYIEEHLSKILQSKLSKERIQSMANYEIIVTGDFNDHSYSIGAEEKKGNYLTPFKHAGLMTQVYLMPTEDIGSCCSNLVPYPMKKTMMRGDYIFDSIKKDRLSSFRLKVPSTYKADLPHSDHLPIIYFRGPVKK
jgi:hypothetical protein